MSLSLRGVAAILALFFLAPAEGSARNLFVVCQDEAILVRLDTLKGKVTAKVGLPQKPAMIASAREGRLLFVSHPELGQISRLEVASLNHAQNFTVGGTPFGIAATADGRFLYVGDWKANVVRKLDAATGAELSQVPVGREPTGLALDPKENRLFVANRESRSVTVIELASMRATKTIEVGDGPFALAFDGGHDRLFVANVRSGDVTVIDAAAEAVAGTVAVGSAPYGVAIDPKSSRVLVASQHGDRVSILDSDLHVSGAIDVGRYPEALIVLDGKAYVTNWFSGDLSVLDLDTARKIATIKLGEGPRSLTLGGEDATR